MKKDSVYELQKMLRKIFGSKGMKITLNPDGIYGSETEKAVRIFQKRHGISPTGTADNETWNAIAEEYKKTIEECSSGDGIVPFYPGCCMTPGEKSDMIYILQVILSALGIIYDDFPEIEINGVFDAPTEQAVKNFQQINRLSPTGVVDVKTWNALAKNYNSYANNPCYVS